MIFVLQIWQGGVGSSQSRVVGAAMWAQPLPWVWLEMPVSQLQPDKVLGICLGHFWLRSGASPWNSAMEAGGTLWWCLQIRWAKTV